MTAQFELHVLDMRLIKGAVFQRAVFDPSDLNSKNVIQLTVVQRVAHSLQG